MSPAARRSTRTARAGLLVLATALLSSGCGLALESSAPPTTVLAPEPGSGPGAAVPAPPPRPATTSTTIPWFADPDEPVDQGGADPTAPTDDALVEALVEETLVDEIRTRRRADADTDACAAGDQLIVAGKELFDLSGASTAAVTAGIENFERRMVTLLPLITELPPAERDAVTRALAQFRASADLRPDPALGPTFAQAIDEHGPAVDRFLDELGTRCPELVELTGVTTSATLVQLLRNL